MARALDNGPPRARRAGGQVVRGLQTFGHFAFTRYDERGHLRSDDRRRTDRRCASSMIRCRTSLLRSGRGLYRSALALIRTICKPRRSDKPFVCIHRTSSRRAGAVTIFFAAPPSSLRSRASTRRAAS
jgi:hypothetical protein